jgi:hypothetical protein
MPLLECGFAGRPEYIYPCEFNGSFMPPRMKVAIGGGKTATEVEVADHISACSCAVRLAICRSSCSLRVR